MIFEITSLEEMCDMMCDNIVPKEKMTSEEAIYRLGWLTATTNDPKDLEAIEMAREALAVEVVRCKDCKHYLNEHICMYFSRHGTIETSSYAYCSYGERREP